MYKNSNSKKRWKNELKELVNIQNRYKLEDLILVKNFDLVLENFSIDQLETALKTAILNENYDLCKEIRDLLIEIDFAYDPFSDEDFIIQFNNKFS